MKLNVDLSIYDSAMPILVCFWLIERLQVAKVTNYHMGVLTFSVSFLKIHLCANLCENQTIFAFSKNR